MAMLTFEERHDLGKALYFVHPKFTLLCMSILTLEQRNNLGKINPFYPHYINNGMLINDQ